MEAGSCGMRRCGRWRSIGWLPSCGRHMKPVRMPPPRTHTMPPQRTRSCTSLEPRPSIKADNHSSSKAGGVPASPPPSPLRPLCCPDMARHGPSFSKSSYTASCSTGGSRVRLQIGGWKQCAGFDAGLIQTPRLMPMPAAAPRVPDCCAGFLVCLVTLKVSLVTLDNATTKQTWKARARVY